MFKKVLIAEDYQSTSISVQKTLKDLGIADAKYVHYCDYAFTWMQKAVRTGEPYELLITDLSFEEDNHNTQNLVSGEELIKAIKVEQPSLKVIVFSVENRPAVVQSLVDKLQIDGYVRKGRRDAEMLREAIGVIYRGGRYISPDIRQAIKEQNSHEFTTFDVTLVTLLYKGKSQKEISDYLQQNNISPSGLSSIEKRLNLMRTNLGFSKNTQLIAYCRDIGII